MLTQLLWDVILQVSGHEELEALIVNGLHGEGKSKQVNRITEVHFCRKFTATTDGRLVYYNNEKREKCDEHSIQVDLP